MRRTKPERREIAPDTKYQSLAVTNLVHRIMERGKKSTAVRIMYQALDIVAEKSGRQPIEVLDLALKNVGPVMEVRPRRVGGATYQVPMEVPSDRRMTLAMRWILDAARARTGKSFAEKLSAEIHPKQDDLRGYRIPHSIPICRFGKGIFPEGIVWSEWPSVIGGEE